MTQKLIVQIEEMNHKIYGKKNELESAIEKVIKKWCDSTGLEIIDLRLSYRELDNYTELRIKELRISPGVCGIDDLETEK